MEYDKLQRGAATSEQRIATGILRLARDVNSHYEQLRKLMSPHAVGALHDVEQVRRNLDTAYYHVCKLAEIAAQTKVDFEGFHAMQTERRHVERDDRVEFEAMYIAHGNRFFERFLDAYNTNLLLYSASQQWVCATNELFDEAQLARNLSELLDLPSDHAETLARAFRNKLSWRVRVALQATPTWFTILKTDAEENFELVVQLAADDVFSMTLDICNDAETQDPSAPIFMSPNTFPLLSDQRNESGETKDAPPEKVGEPEWSNKWTKLVTSALESFDYESQDYGKYVIHVQKTLGLVRNDKRFNPAYELLELLLSDFGKKHVLGDLPVEADSISKVARMLAVVELDAPRPRALETGSHRPKRCAHTARHPTGFLDTEVNERSEVATHGL